MSKDENAELEAGEEFELEADIEDGGDADPIEELAIKMGYNPNYDGENKRTAAEFILKGKDMQVTLKETVDRLKSSVDEIKDSARAYKKHADATVAVKIAEAKKEIERLKAERKTAILDGDVDLVEKLDNDIDAKKEVVPTEPLPEFTEWHKKNDWYDTDTELTEYADAQAKLPKYIGMAPKRLFAEIERTVKKSFPDKFPSEKKDSPRTPGKPAVEAGGHRGGGKKKTLTKADLSSEEKAVMTDAIALGVYKTEAEYISDLNKGSII